MHRRTNTDKNSNSWTETIKTKVWEKGQPIPNYSEDTWRVDRCGSIMQFAEYGNRDSKFGWEIAHDIPVNQNGTDDLHNLQPLHWVNNLKKD